MNSEFKHGELTSENGLIMNTTGTPRGGRIGLVRCPGASGYLEEDLQWLVSQKASLLLSLITSRELQAMGLEQLGVKADAAGLSWHHLPVTDMHAPSAQFANDWPAVMKEMLDRLANNELLVLHCRAGIGRAGTIAARILTETGLTPEQAIDAIRLARPGAIETRDQEQWIKSRLPLS